VGDVRAGDGRDCGAPAPVPRAGDSVMDRIMASRRGGWMAGRRAGGRGRLAALIWLAFIIFPLVSAVTNKGSVLDKVLTITAAALFVGSYVWMVLTAFGSRRRSVALILCGVLVALALALTIGDRPGWGFLFSYCAACVALLWPADTGFQAIVVLTLVAGGACVLGGGSAGEGIGYGASTIGVGLLMVLLRDLRTRNDELNEARAELADVAVAHERERFARDLHDLLGHSLSVIALKAELAGKLIAERPGEAAVEVREVETVARQALGEVRDAVSGYRRPTLEGELAGARMALTAAGIDSEVQPPAAPVAPEVEAVLAWAVREGATNVIRHSGARRCSLRVSTGLADVAVEVIDDGRGGGNGRYGPGDRSPDAGEGGNGLLGLAERAADMSGSVESGTLPDGSGFRLRVSIPLGAGSR
jgi:two-component system sensor histidine kinase DesK